ncbi:TAP42 domain-containing protein [Phanerochaete sordida]|uniref:TAP42 domain-containing protein n=1 Tax=Phanerochaete sordida TaxID=48140 RepID=A0A9P3LA06_9APHY|nr:TAP42 domain-containing protein [Phanerochaete sordida]
MDLPLGNLFNRALITASKAFDLPTIQDQTQDLIHSSLSDLTTVRNRVRDLALFSPNETLQDIATKDLVYLFVPFTLAEVENRARTTDPQERLGRLGRAQAYLKEYLSYLENYEIVPPAEKELYDKKTNTMVDPAKRRELKIKQYQKEKEIRGMIEAVRKRRNLSAGDEPASDFELIASLLPTSSAAQSTPEAEEDSDTEDILREAALLLFRLTYAQAQTSLESLEQEQELLKSIPSAPKSSDDPRQKDGKAKEQDDMWRLDSISRGGPDGKGPLLDPQGKPLRPFTILPSGAADRARLQAQVFQADHRLPTMSIDEYLEIEQQRGNVITGGGPASENKLTTSEQLQLDSEMDGTAFAEQRGEEKRQKDEKWAQYTDVHQKGEGNRMNRG